MAKRKKMKPISTAKAFGSIDGIDVLDGLLLTSAIAGVVYLGFAIFKKVGS